MSTYTTGENDAPEVVAARVLEELYAYPSRVSSDLTSVVKVPQGAIEVCPCLKVEGISLLRIRKRGKNAIVFA